MVEKRPHSIELRHFIAGGKSSEESRSHKLTSSPRNGLKLLMDFEVFTHLFARDLFT